MAKTMLDRMEAMYGKMEYERSEKTRVIAKFCERHPEVPTLTVEELWRKAEVQVTVENF